MLYYFFRCIVLIIFLITTNTPGQIKVEGFSAGLGAGTIKGNFPAVFSYSFNVGIDTKLFSLEDPFFRFNLLFAKDFNSLLPEERTNRYYPFLQGMSLTAVKTIHFYKNAYLEESAGLLMLNDRTFSDIDLISYGVVFSLAIKLPLYDPNTESKGFFLGIETNYGLTLTNKTPQYFAIQLMGRYQL